MRRHTMSGPKTSRYTVTAAQRENMLEQNRCDSSIIACISQIGNVFSNVNDALSEIEIFEDTGGDINTARTADLKVRIKNIESKQRKLKAQFSGFSTYKRPAVVTPSNQELERKKSKLVKLNEMKKEAGDVLKEIDRLKKSADQIYHDISSEIEKNLQTSFELSWDWGEESTADAVKDTDLSSLKEDISTDLNELFAKDLSPKLRERVQLAINKVKQIENEEYLRNFRAIIITPLTKECRHYSEVKMKFGDKFEDLNYRYISLCDMLGVEHEVFSLSEESCTQLERKIALLEKELYEADEQEYIADTIDEVMEEMGYSLIGSREVTKKNGKRFRDELYTFSEGTAVNIRYDSQGKISMELGGMDTTDRVPTDSEASILCNGMVDFCNKFTEFEKRLAAKGVICKDRISHLPPNAEYAQIINSSDYKLKQEVKSIKAERRQAVNARKKQYRNG